MIITLTGPNTFAIAAAEHQLARAFTDKHGANGIDRIDAENITPERLPDLLQGATLFAPARLVIIKNLGANKPLLDILPDALGTASADNTVVISDAALDKRTKLYKFLKTKSQFKELAQLNEAQLAKWVHDQVAQAGGQIASADARYLVDRTAGDQWRLSHEIQKLVAYKPEISRQTINELVEPSLEGTAFELLDAALSGRVAETTHLLMALKQSEDPYKLFGLLASQVHTLAVVAAAGNRLADTIAADSGLHPFVVRKTQSMAKKLGPARVARMAADVATCDMQLKSTGADPWDLLQICVQKIAT